MSNAARVGVEVVAAAVATSAEPPADGDVWHICRSDSVGRLRT
jgi:hypothetical protein